MKTILTLGLCLTLATTGAALDSLKVDYDQREKDILAILNEGLREWYSGKPTAYTDAFATSITYFDPGTEGKRILTHKELHELVQNRETAYDYSEVKQPVFQHSDEVSVLTFNLNQDFKGGVSLNWNATEVYKKTDNGYEIIHAHWSPYSDDLTLIPSVILLWGGIIGALLLLAIGLFIGKRWGRVRQHA